MMKGRTLRFRMMLLFCTVVGVLLAGSYLAFWGLLAHEVSTQLNRQLVETARPIIADLMTEPSEQDVNRLDFPRELFQLLEPAVHATQHTRSPPPPLELN